MDNFRTLSEKLTKFGIGTSRIASMFDKMPQNLVNDLFSKALENNIRVIDTADTYGSGDSEITIGKAIKNKRDEYFIISKAGFPYVSLPTFFSPLNQVGKKIIQKFGIKNNYSKAYLLKYIGNK